MRTGLSRRFEMGRTRPPRRRVIACGAADSELLSQ